MIIINEEPTSANGADLQPYQPQFLQRLIPPADERRECVSRLWIWLEGRQPKEGNLHVAKKGNFCLRPLPPSPTPSLHVFFHQGGPALFQRQQRVIYRWRPTSSRPPQIALLFLTSRLCESVISLILSALRDTTSPPHPHTPPPPLRHRAAFTSMPVSFLLALFVFCARRVTTAAPLRASRCCRHFITHLTPLTILISSPTDPRGIVSRLQLHHQL